MPGFDSKRHPSGCRLQASNFIQLLCRTCSHSADVHLVRTQLAFRPQGPTHHSPSFPQMSRVEGSGRPPRRGLCERSELIVHALNEIGSVFQLQSPTSAKNDFWLFVREGLLDPLSSVLLNVMASSGEAAADMKQKIIQILLIFCGVSQSDVHVRNALGTWKVVRRMCFARSSWVQMTEIEHLQGCCGRAIP